LVLRTEGYKVSEDLEKLLMAIIQIDLAGLDFVAA
jgi:hypothetical protein